METIKEDKNVKEQPKFITQTDKKILRALFIVLIALFAGTMHYTYVSHLFENDRNFSYLSDLEREMSFRTEMGFYYSYYKTIVEERPFIAGITRLMYDRLVEYPSDVNAFNRFNIHPEVIIGSIYRYFEPILNTSQYRVCHMIDRGSDIVPVESCVGIGQPIMFYLEAIWWLAGLTVIAIFLHAVTLSASIFGGILAVLQYFANHAECTRVQWSPNERENLAAPLLLLQMWLLTLQLKDKGKKTKFQLQVSIFLINCLCLLFWQFSQFIFLTQTAILFVMEQLKIIDIKSLCVFMHSHFCGLHLAVLLLQGNDMLKTSLYASFFLVVSAYCMFFSSFRIRVQSRLDLFVEAWLVFLRITLSVVASLYLKTLISDFLDVEEDSHIWDILYSKFTDYKNFHTLLYTCSEVFDFLPFSSIKNLSNTLLIPIVLYNVFNVCTYWLSNAIYESPKEKETEDDRVILEKDDQDSDSGIENTESKAKVKDMDVICKKLEEPSIEKTKDKFVCFLINLNVEPAVFYNISQMVVFGFMAALVMRLKLLFGTQMCIVSALLMNSSYYTLPKSVMKYLPVIWVLVIALVVQTTVMNMNSEMRHVGEFSDVPQEQLLEWAKSEAGAGGAFAGSMPILASVMLSARRPIVAHPHYEHSDARERAYTVYKTYSKITPHMLYQELAKMRVTYLIVEMKYCYGKSSKGCSFEDIWDIEDPKSKGNPRVCHTLLTEAVEHFYPVFWNNQYAVFRIHDLSVRYMPRSFDT